MPLSPGKRLGSYEILAIIGVGGMGEVYKARDLRLDRLVAIKILPEHIAADRELRQRFEREAKAISSLSHPHICTLHDVGTDADIEYLVMEYLEGETLAQRLAKGALPSSQVLRVAVQVAEALEQAHRQGVTHRDLKPGNVMITKAGAKLLDFGLAKLRPAPVDSTSGARTATPGSMPPAELTARGTLLGTLQYMAPEQLEGRTVDHRSDVFAFGAIVHEMATGQKAFDGKSQASLIGAILKDEPTPISTLQPLSPPALDALVATCLAKDPDERWQSIGDVGRQLRLMQASSSQPRIGATAPAIAAPQRGNAWRSVALALASVAAGVALAVVAGRGLTPPVPPESRLTSRFSIVPPPDAPLVGHRGYDIAVSPDGTAIVYVAQLPGLDRFALYVRRIDELEPRLVPGTEGIVGRSASPFFSPDGQQVAFRSFPGEIVRIALDTGAPRSIADVGSDFAGGMWAPDDTIYFASEGALHRVSAGGGSAPQQLIPAARSSARVGPTLLPNGRALLFTVDDSNLQDAAVLDLTTGEERVVVEDATNPQYLPQGHLVFVRGTTLMTTPFDLATLRVTGEPIAAIERIRRNDGGAADFRVADSGTLVYVPGADDPSARQAVWVDRAGRVIGPAVNAPGERVSDPRLSADDRRLVLTVGPPDKRALWLYDLGGRPPIPLVTEGSDARLAIWSPEGGRVAYVARRGNAYDAFITAADGSGRGSEAVVTDVSGVEGWSADDELILFSTAAGSGDVVAVSLRGDRAARNVVATRDAEGSAAFSPDGRWLAYATNRTGAFELWARRYPDGIPLRVSETGGSEPIWSRDGSELFYRRGTAMMSVAVDPEAQNPFQTPSLLFDGAYIAAQNPTERSYDVAADGRFLMLQTPGADTAQSATIVVIQNWMGEIERTGTR